MRIATWNINSLRVRLTQLTTWLASNPVDVIALQETKCPDEGFPRAEIEALGYQVVASGQKSYNGVAILSKLPIEDVVRDMPGYTDEQKRVLSATIGGVRIVNVYVRTDNRWSRRSISTSWSGCRRCDCSCVMSWRATRGWWYSAITTSRRRIRMCTTPRPGKAMCW